MEPKDFIIKPDSRILVTGGCGFIGKRVIDCLVDYGFTNIACLTRKSERAIKNKMFRSDKIKKAQVEVVHGNLLSREDCLRVSKDAQVIYHLAAGRGEKSFADAYLNSVVTTRNLIDACIQQSCIKRFVNVSSLSVYTNQNKQLGKVLDENCPIERNPALRHDPYSYAKTKQDEILIEYGKKYSFPYTLVRPGLVYGPGNEKIHGRVGIGTFGVFLHLGGSNIIPMSYVDNCAEAIALAGITAGVNGEVFNVVDDELLSSRRFIVLYKKNVKKFPSIYLPKFLSFFLCLMWEKFYEWSEGQLPATFNRKSWYVYWKPTTYSNDKLKMRLGWKQKVSTSEGLRQYFMACREMEDHA